MEGGISRNGGARAVAPVGGLGVGPWEWDIRTGRLQRSPELYEIYGVEQGVDQAATAEALLAFVHPEDRARATAVVTDTLATRREHHEQRFRIVRPGGEVRHILSRARLLCDADGLPIKLIGVDVDLTAGTAEESPLASQDGRAGPDDAAADALDGLWAEIEGRFGICPSFFKLARSDPPTARMLWRMAQDAYLDLPAPSLFKEQLFTCLSRFCQVPYCVARHAGFLMGLGRPAADATAPTLTAEQVVALLEQPSPPASELPDILAAVEAEPAPLSAWPDLESETGRRIRIACEAVFLNPADARPWLAALHRLLGARRYEQLMLFLAFVRVANFWTELHPELELEGDLRRLLEEHDALAQALQPASEDASRAVTARLREETSALVEQHRLAEQLRRITDALPAQVAYVDRDQRYIFVNAAYADERGLAQSAIIGRTVRDVLHEDGYREAQPHLEAALRGQGVQRYEVEPQVRGDPTPIHQVTFVPHQRSDGSIAGCTVLVVDITERKVAEAALRESQARFQEMADNAPMMVWVSDAAGHCTYLSRSWYEFTGRSPKAGLGLRWLDAVHPDDRDQARRTFLAANARREALRLEYRLRRADGEHRWAIDAAAPRFDQQGEFLGYIGSVIDISERKEAEDRQALLMREVDHRARNALAVVQSVVRLTRADDPADYVATVEGRIGAIAHAHTLLAESGWTSARLRSLLERELEAHALERVTLSGEEIVLRPEAAQPLALAIHELVTNAAKYGALSSASGRLEVTWRLDPAAEGVQITWRESGGPPVRPPARQSFGSTLIATAVEQQLGGTARQEWNPQGLVCELLLPLERLRGATVRASTQGKRETEAMRVLVIEDEMLIALDVEQTLRGLGYQVVGPVGRLADALEIIEREPLDAVVLDADLGGESAAPVAERLRALVIPFVVATGYGLLPEFGAIDQTQVLTKPIADRDLRRALQAALAGRNA